ncbi:MAG: TIGR03790 family protein [Cyanobacteriota bacterium]|nr:TIGR03790 family protein [Cyanobacteriota bacterium]
MPRLLPWRPILLFLSTGAAAILVAKGQMPRIGFPEDGNTPLGPKHLALVINEADPLSEAIGAHYIKARNLEPRQVIRVRFPAGKASLTAAEFLPLYRQVQRQTPSDLQAYALAWAAPWRVDCLSITSAFAFGKVRSICPDTCRATPISPYFANGEVRRPWSSLGLRPTILLAATTPEAARVLIQRGIAADGTAPPGTAYLLSSTDQTRNRRAEGYGDLLRISAPGFQVRVLQGDALRGAKDVMLYMTGLTHVPDLASNQFRPGAVGDHLTSFGGVLTGPSGHSQDGGNGQMSALRWLEAGATGSYGTVVEPCNHRGKFPDPGLLLSYYRRGDTLIESYWRSVAMPEQGVFIGEPLARPWGPKPKGLGQ